MSRPDARDRRRARRGGARLPRLGRGARHRAAGRPADPGVAVRLGARRWCSSSRSSALAVLWRTPQLQEPHRSASGCRAAGGRRRRSCGAIGIALFAVVVYSGFAGTQTPTANFAPTFIYVTFWVGLVVASVLFGDVFAAFSPWRAAARAVAWIAPARRRRASRRRRCATRSGSAAGRPRSGCCASPGSSWPTQPRRPVDARAPRARLRGRAAGGHELLRHRRVERPRRRLRRLLRPLSRGSPVCERARRRALPAAAAVGLAAARPDPGHGRAAVRLDRDDELRRLLPGPGRGPTWPTTSSSSSSTSGFTPATRARARLDDRPADRRSLIVAGLYRARRRWACDSRAAEHAPRELSRAVRPHARADRGRLRHSRTTSRCSRSRARRWATSSPTRSGHGSNLFGTADATINYNVVCAHGIWYVQVGGAGDRPRRRPRPGPRPGARVYHEVREADALAVLDAPGDDRLHSLGLWLLSAINDTRDRSSRTRRPLAADLAIYVGPILIIGLGLWIADRREKRRRAREDGAAGRGWPVRGRPRGLGRPRRGRRSRGRPPEEQAQAPNMMMMMSRRHHHPARQLLVLERREPEVRAPVAVEARRTTASG